ncbi:hypothetical protein QVD17_09198 [Tagetes erecta]|uniref:RRM domain-containing protein n=1 Tax=Tagetes erecta TaxID=13708 RepID=A0AAD8P3R1_TARER|nr:hypothetical protein QVD17_09198 [Tagetes erecta]
MKTGEGRTGGPSNGGDEDRNKDNGERAEREINIHGTQQENDQRHTQGNWQKHLSKHTRKKTSGKNFQWIPKIPLTSYFIYNIPEEATEKSLMEVFKPFGNLVTVHIPVKRDVHGNRFGFARYTYVDDKIGLEKSLKGIKVDEAVLGINLHTTVVMEVKSLDILDQFDAICVRMGLSNPTLKYLGGMHVLVVFGSKEDACTFISDKDKWSPHADSVHLWDERFNTKDRIAWLYIRGVPAGLWNQDTLELIANCYGKTVQSSEINPSDSNLAVDRIGVITRQLDRISDFINLKWRNETFRIAIEEDYYYWYPKFLAEPSPPETTPNMDNLKPQPSPVTSKTQQSQEKVSDDQPNDINAFTNVTSEFVPIHMEWSNTINAPLTNEPPKPVNPNPKTDTISSPGPTSLPTHISRKRQRISNLDLLAHDDLGDTMKHTSFSLPQTLTTNTIHTSNSPPPPVFDPNIKFPTLLNPPFQTDPPSISNLFTNPISPLPTTPPPFLTTAPPPSLSISNASEPPNPNLTSPISTFTPPQHEDLENNLHVAKLLGINELECIAFIENATKGEVKQKRADFHDIISKANDDFNFSGPRELYLISKLKFIKDRIKVWAADLRSKESEFDKTLWNDLTSLEEATESRQLSEDEEWAYGECKKGLLEIEQLRLKDTWQKSRVKWACDGDDNSNFFHRSIKVRTATNRIHGIDVDGSWITKPNIIKREVRRYFNSRFQEDTPIRPSFNCPGLKKLSMDDGAILTRPFEDSEIKHVVWDCGERHAMVMEMEASSNASERNFATSSMSVAY